MKVFGIGFQRTGVSSLAAALNMLDIRTLQFPKDLYRNIEHKCIRKFDGFTDNPLPIIYKELDAHYPGSKFIHTVRDEESWLKSVHWLFTAGAVKFREAKVKYGDEFHKRLYGTAEYDAEVFLKAYRAYNQDVCDYFAKRPHDYLKMRINEGDGFEVLCPFLDVPVPDTPFPHRNKNEPLSGIIMRQMVRRTKQ